MFLVRTPIALLVTAFRSTLASRRLHHATLPELIQRSTRTHITSRLPTLLFMGFHVLCMEFSTWLALLRKGNRSADHPRLPTPLYAVSSSAGMHLHSTTQAGVFQCMHFMSPAFNAYTDIFSTYITINYAIMHMWMNCSRSIGRLAGSVWGEGYAGFGEWESEKSSSEHEWWREPRATERCTSASWQDEWWYVKS